VFGDYKILLSCEGIESILYEEEHFYYHKKSLHLDKSTNQGQLPRFDAIQYSSLLDANIANAGTRKSELSKIKFI